MRKPTVLLGMLALVLAACGGGEAGGGGSDLPTDVDEPNVAGACLAEDPDCEDIGDPNADTPPADASDEPITPSDSLSPSQVLAAGTIDGSFVVQGFLFVDADGNAELCDLILESYPPQCGGESLPVAGDLSLIEMSSDQGLSWTDSAVALEGTFDGTTFTIEG
ncbi:MAG: hypothetical protein ACLGHX_01960 [Acidimicrobiia bacterium]